MKHNSTPKRFSTLVLIWALLLSYGAPTKAQDTPGTVKFPAAADSLDSLVRASNSAKSTLTSSITSSSTSIVVASAASFPASGLLQIDTEIIAYTSKSSTTFSGLTRGADSTTAAAHNGGASVRGVIAAAHHNTLAAALEAVELKMGYFASTPTSGKVLVGTGVGTSEWQAAPALNCANCTGLTGATGGVSNTGSTTIGADTDSSGGGVISLQTQNVERVRIDPDGTITIPGGANIPDKGAKVINVKAFGALGNGTTDDSINVAAALGAALAATKPLYFPAGHYLLSTGTTELLLITKPIRIFGDGMNLSRLRVKSTVGTSTAVIRFKPTTPETDSRGFIVENLGTEAQSGAPGGASIILDTTNAFIANFAIRNCYFGTLGGSYSVQVVNSSADGVFTGTIDGNIGYAGLDLRDNSGDTINVWRNVITGDSYALRALLGSGATTLNVIGNYFTSKLGVLVEAGIMVNFEHNILEIFQTSSVGNNGAAVAIKGTGAGAVSGINFSHNVISSLNGNTLDGVLVQNTDRAFFEHNRFDNPTTKAGVRIGTGATNTYVDTETNHQYGAGLLVSNSADAALMLGSVKAFAVQQASAQGGFIWIDKGIFNLGIQPGAISFAAIATNFPTPGPGQTFFCTDCTPGTTPCTGGSAMGALALRTSNGQWACK